MTIETRAKKQGSTSANQIYVSVGVALSWWEASEDIIMGAFAALCSKTEPIAFESYVRSNRAPRGRMLKSAINTYVGYFTKEESDTILKAIAKLDKLAPQRNQIAHGHVSRQKIKRNGVLEMDGFFLVPSLNENGHQINRDLRYAHTAADIDFWRESVRAERAKILDTSIAAMRRANETRS